MGGSSLTTGVTAATSSVVGERRVERRQHAGDRLAGAGGERDHLVGAGVDDRDADTA